MKKVEEIINKIKNNIFEKEDVLYALNIKTEKEFAPFFQLSEEICEKIYGKNVYARGIIEFSNYCRKNCFYCGIRRENKNLERYRIPYEEILKTMEIIKKDRVQTVVLQSGEDLKCDEFLPALIKDIKEKYDIAITLSIGERPYEVYKELKKDGADRFLLRIETTDKELFKKLHPDDDFENRKQCLYYLKDLGYEVGTGVLIGLPWQTTESLVNDLFFLKELQPDMVGIGPFIPHNDTPLKDFKNNDIFMTLKMVSLIRIILKDVNIPATTAMGTIDPYGRQKALKVGANVIMPNYTPYLYKDKFKLYNNKICINENCSVKCTEIIAKYAGKKIISDKGFRKKIFINN